MKMVEFEGQNVVYGKDQPEYLPLPAHKVANDPQGRLICCWDLSFLERIKLLFTGKIWHQILTFDRSLQPQLLSVDNPIN